MLKFRLNSSKIEIIIDTGLSLNIITTYECNSPLYAELLYNQLRAHQAKLIEEFAKDNYLKGYSDKTKRNPKSTWWPSILNYRWYK